MAAVRVEPQRETPVVEEADVVVCGGGPAGVAAAIAAGACRLRKRG
jgi:cation diffusion facilitator CzcD-associated flavoprotein CzcO